MTIPPVSKAAREVLAFPLDFNMDDLPVDPLWFRVEPSTSLTPIAGDGTGGVYCLVNDSGEILFVDSEGSGGLIAPSFACLITLFVSFPFWQDLLKFSGGGNLEEMRRVAPYAHDEYFECYPEIPHALATLKEIFGVVATDESLRELHSCVSSSNQRLALFASDGHPLGSLFNRFTLESNPDWKRKLTQK